MLLSVIILKEPAGWQQWSGGILVIFGMIMIGTGSIPAKKPLEGFSGRQRTIKEY
jgi:drug/metabolite transporter (DMT)-like permease